MPPTIFPLAPSLSKTLIQQFKRQYAIGTAMAYDLMLKPSDCRRGMFVCGKPARLRLLQLHRRMRAPTGTDSVKCRVEPVNSSGCIAKTITAGPVLKLGSFLMPSLRLEAGLH